MRTSKFTIAARKRQLRDLLVTRKITRKRYAELRHADRVYYMQARRGVWDYIDRAVRDALRPAHGLAHSAPRGA